MEGLALGGFRVGETLGAGGMGEVRRALHEATGTEVAIKLITAHHARRRAYLDALRHEIWALARLDHTGIVMVLDHGEVDAEAERASGGRLVEGSPWLVMELAGGGTLHQLGRAPGWPVMRSLLLAVLDALAHAHARGVVHRDVKPANVLFARAAQTESLKLADFGLAHALHAAPEAHGLGAGTPWYMAPEQVLGRWREQGPWTDLYAVGCLAYRLASGRPPYWQLDADSTRVAQIEAPAAVLEPAFPVPAALRGWLDASIAKKPRARFQTAADSARALRALPVEVGPRPWTSARATPPDRPGPAQLAPVEATASLPEGPRMASEVEDTIAAPPGMSRSSLPPPSRSAPPPPSDWRTEATALRAPDVLAAGLALHGLRSVPIAGRERERDALWEALAEVVHTRELRVVLLEGDPGVGKSRLAEWLETRALELGVAWVTHATHAPTPGPSDGLRPGIRRWIGGEGLDADLLAEHLRERIAGLGASAAEEIAAVLAGVGGATQADRHAALRGLIEAWCAERPGLLVLDDAPWSAESMSFVDHLLRARGLGALPLCVVITARRGDPAVDAVLGELRARAEVRAIAVEALPGDQLAELVRRRLALDDAVARQVEERSGGNPLFAVQLVRDWVARGLLVGEGGALVLRAGEVPALPDDLHALWRERVDRVLGGLREAGDVSRGQAGQAPWNTSEAALEIAAVLGRDVDLVEWNEAAREAEVVVPRELIEALGVAGLATVRDGVLHFAHALLRESLERRVKEAGRAEVWNRACAAMLRSRAGREGVAERLAHHLLEAGELEAALEPLIAAARAPVETSDFARAYAALERREAAMARLGLAADDPRRAVGEVTRAWVHVVRGALDDADACLDRASAALSSRAARLRAEATWLRGVIAQKRGAPARAGECFAAALETWQAEGGDPANVARCVHGLAECAKLKGDLDAAERGYADAAARFLELDDPVWASRALGGVADTQRRRGNLEGARAVLVECAGLLARARNRHLVAVNLTTLGDVQRDGGDLAAAEQSYRESVRTFEELASREASLVRMNLGLVLLAQASPAQAREVFSASRRDLKASGREGYVLFAEAGLLAARTALGEIDLDAWDAVARGVEASKMVDPDLAWCFEHIAASAVRAGAPELEREARALAARQRAGLATDGSLPLGQ